MLSGIDVSHHQGAVDWPRVAAAGHTFAFAKATEGISFRDSRFAQNWAGMAAARLVRGAYHFLSPTSDPVLQARAFVSAIGDPRGSLTALDVETTASGGKPNGAMAHKFADEFRRLTGGHPLVVYTGRWYWRDTIGNPHGADIGPLWHSAYSGSPGALYGGWDRFALWQWTSSGVVPGVAGRCDVNHFFGERNDLLALTGVPVDTPTPSKEDDMSGQFIVLPVAGPGVGPQFWCDAGVCTQMTDGSTLATLREQGARVYTPVNMEDAANMVEAYRQAAVATQMADDWQERAVEAFEAIRDDLADEEPVEPTGPSVRSDT